MDPVAVLRVGWPWDGWLEVYRSSWMGCCMVEREREYCTRKVKNRYYGCFAKIGLFWIHRYITEWRKTTGKSQRERVLTDKMLQNYREWKIELRSGVDMVSWKWWGRTCGDIWWSWGIARSWGEGVDKVPFRVRSINSGIAWCRGGKVVLSRQVAISSLSYVIRVCVITPLCVITLYQWSRLI